MPSQIQTPEDVCALLTELCRSRGAFAATPLEVDAQVNWRRRFLANDVRAWTALMIRCSCRAAGERETERYRDRGWTRRTYDAAWRRAAWAIVEGIGAERVNAAAIDQGLQSEAMLEANGKLEMTCGLAPLYRVA